MFCTYFLRVGTFESSNDGKRKCYENALVKAPFNLSAKLNLADVLLDQKDYEKAADMYEKVLEHQECGLNERVHCVASFFVFVWCCCCLFVLFRVCHRLSF